MIKRSLDALEKVAHFLTGGESHDRFRAIAEKRGGVFVHDGRSWLTSHPWHADFPVDDLLVRLDRVIRGHGRARRYRTRLRVQYVLGTGPAFAIQPEQIFSSISKAFGKQDIELGRDKAFDDHFLVSTQDPSSTREAWTLEAMKLALRSHLDSEIIADHSMVGLEFTHEHAHDDAKINDAIDLVATLASFGKSWLAPLREFSGATYAAPKGAFGSRSVPVFYVPVRNTAVAYYSTFVEREFAFSAAAKLERELPPLRARFDGQPSDAEVPKTVMPLEGKSHLLVALPGDLEISRGWVRFTVRGAMNQERLRAAGELVVSIARGEVMRGAFR